MNFERGTTYCFLVWTVRGLLTNSRPSFPDLVQPLYWTLQLISVWPFIPHFLHTDPCRQFWAMWPSRPHLKQLITWVTSVTSVNSSTSVNSFTSRARVWGKNSAPTFISLWPNLLHLWHLKRGPAGPDFSQGVKRPWRKAERSPPFTTTVKNEWSYTSTPPHFSMTSTTASPLLHMQIHLTFRYRIWHSWYIKDCIRSEIWPEAIMKISVDWEDQGIFNDFASSVALT